MASYRLYGFGACPHCKRALNHLLLLGAKIDYVRIPTIEERKAWMDERGFAGPDRTFPRVYRLDGEREVLIGGADDLIASTALTRQVA